MHTSAYPYITSAETESGNVVFSGKIDQVRILEIHVLFLESLWKVQQDILGLVLHMQHGFVDLESIYYKTFERVIQ